MDLIENKIIFNCNSEMSENENKIIFDSVYQGEYTIQNLIKSDNNCSAHFTYNTYPGRGFELIVMTYNPKHQTFHFVTLLPLIHPLRTH